MLSSLLLGEPVAGQEALAASVRRALERNRRWASPHVRDIVAMYHPRKYLAQIALLREQLATATAAAAAAAAAAANGNGGVQ